MQKNSTVGVGSSLSYGVVLDWRLSGNRFCLSGVVLEELNRYFIDLSGDK